MRGLPKEALLSLRHSNERLSRSPDDYDDDCMVDAKLLLSAFASDF